MVIFPWVINFIIAFKTSLAFESLNVATNNSLARYYSSGKKTPYSWTREKTGLHLIPNNLILWQNEIILGVSIPIECVSSWRTGRSTLSATLTIIGPIRSSSSSCAWSWLWVSSPSASSASWWSHRHGRLGLWWKSHWWWCLWWWVVIFEIDDIDNCNERRLIL